MLALLQPCLCIFALAHQDGEDEQRDPDAKQEELQGEDVRRGGPADGGALIVGHASDGNYREQARVGAQKYHIFGYDNAPRADYSGYECATRRTT
jgi:hypothetical protein